MLLLNLFMTGTILVIHVCIWVSIFLLKKVGSSISHKKLYDSETQDTQDNKYNFFMIFLPLGDINSLCFIKNKDKSCP